MAEKNTAGGNAGNTNPKGTTGAGENAGAADAVNLNPSTGPNTAVKTAGPEAAAGTTQAAGAQAENSAATDTQRTSAGNAQQVGPTAEQIAQGNTSTEVIAGNNSTFSNAEASEQGAAAKEFVKQPDLPGNTTGQTLESRMSAASGSMAPRALTAADFQANAILAQMGLQVGDVISMPTVMAGGPDTNTNRMPHSAPAFNPAAAQSKSISAADLPEPPAGSFWAERNGVHTIFSAASWELLGTDTAGWRRVNTSVPDGINQYRQAQ